MIVVVGDVEIPWSWTNDDHSRIFELYRIYVIIAMIEKLNYCEHFYNVFGMTRSLTVDWTRYLPLSKPALF